VGAEGNDFLPDDRVRELSKDRIFGGPGNDVIDVLHYRSARDRVVCGRGFDRVGADRKDVVAPDCEKVVVFKGGPISEYDDVLFNVFYASVPNTFFEGLPPCPMGEERVVRGES
jgi:hypothetical protein